MKDWFEIAGPILLGIIIGLAAIAFRYLLKMPPKGAFIFALVLALFLLLFIFRSW